MNFKDWAIDELLAYLGLAYAEDYALGAAVAAEIALRYATEIY